MGAVLPAGKPQAGAHCLTLLEALSVLDSGINTTSYIMDKDQGSVIV